MKKKLFISLASLLGIALLASCSTGNINTGDENVTSVKFNVEEYTFNDVGATFDLTVTVEVLEGKKYNGDISWNSSLPNIASVAKKTDDAYTATVTSKKGGECYVTAIAGYKFATCKIIVNGPDDPLGEFTLSQRSIEIKPNTNYSLTALLDGVTVNSDVVWSSSDESVATVSNGVVNGVNEGNAIISATYSGQTAKCNVKVSSEAVVEFTIRLDKTSVTLLEGASTTVRAILSEEAQVVWSSSDESVATVSNGVINALSEGSTIITATANEQSATCTVTVNKPATPVGPEDDDDKCVEVRFYIDYNNIDKNKPYAKFNWYQNVPLIGAEELPANPTTSMDPAFPNFVGWSTHTIIDSKDDLWEMAKDFVDGTQYTLTLYGIWLAEGEVLVA